MADDPPPLMLASSRSDTEVAQQRAFDLISWPLRELTANLLRVTRGAGSPYDIYRQVVALEQVLREAHEFHDFWSIPHLMARELQSALPEWRLAEEEFDDSGANVVRGSLQYIASRLVYQPMQEAAGSREIESGLLEAERTRELRREQRRLEEAEWRKQERANRKPRTPKPKSSLSAKLVEKQPVSKPMQKPSAIEDERPASTAEFMRRRAEELGAKSE